MEVDKSPKKIEINRNYFVNGLPDDMMVNIFQRLPVKYIHRSRAVCKPWNALILKEKKHLPSSMTGFFYKPKFDRRCKIKYKSTQNTNDKTIDTNLRFLPFNRVRSIVTCSNGLILCNEDPRSRESCLLVCNPATKKWATLPYDPRGAANDRVLVLAFDPAISRHFTVIVLGNFYAFRGGVMSVFFEGVFSSETNRWSAVDDNVPRLPIGNTSFLNEVVYMNGTIHLLDIGRSSIIATDLKGRIIRRLGVSFVGDSMQWGMFHISNLAGKLMCAVVTEPVIRVWVLEDYRRGRWVVKHDIRTRIGIGAYSSEDILIGTYISSFKAFHTDLDVVILELPEKDKFIAYHLVTRKETDLVPLPPARKQVEVFPYSPCYLENIDLMK